MSNINNNLPTDPDELAKRMQEDFAKRGEVLSDEEAKEAVWLMQELAEIIVDSKIEEIREKNRKKLLNQNDAGAIER